MSLFLQFGKGFAGFFNLFVRSIELETGVIFGDRFLVFVQLRSCLSQREMSIRIVWNRLDGILAAQVSTTKIAAIHVEVSYAKIFLLALIRGLQLGSRRIDAVQNMPAGRLLTFAALVLQLRRLIGSGVRARSRNRSIAVVT